MDYYSGSLARGLSQRGCKAIIYSNFTGIDPDTIDYHEYFEGHSGACRLVKLFRLVAATIKASYDARKQKTSLLIIHLFSADIVTLLLVAIPKIFGLKTAVISHDVSSFAENDSHIIQNLIYNRFADFIVVHNLFSRKTLLKNINIIDEERVVMIKHGGYLDHIGSHQNRKTQRREQGLEEKGKYILFFGQIKIVKGLNILVDALSRTSKDIKLIIAGKPWKDDFLIYDKQITQMGLGERVVKMIRFIEDDEREKLFFAADINVLPYRIIYQSGVLLMAMSHGLPVIASDLLPNREIIADGENGMLFKSENVEDLAMKIDSFFQEHPLNEKIRMAAIETIRTEYCWNIIAEKYVTLL